MVATPVHLLGIGRYQVSRGVGLKVFGGQPVPGSARRCLKLTRFLNLQSFHEPFRPSADITPIKPAVIAGLFVWPEESCPVHVDGARRTGPGRGWFGGVKPNARQI